LWVSDNLKLFDQQLAIGNYSAPVGALGISVA
jgi:hypothetical protein